MTVIAWDGKTLAADRQGEMNYVKVPRAKLRRVGAALVSGAGEGWLIHDLIAWYMAGARPQDFPAAAREDTGTTLLVIDGHRRILLYQRGPYPVLVDGERIAIGSGAEAASAALFLGCSSAKAVEVACAVSTGCGGGVDTLEFAPA